MQTSTSSACCSLNTILILDDSKIVRRSIANDLAPENYRIFEASSLADFHPFLSSNAPRPDLFLIDLILPDGNGLDAIGELRAHPDFKSAPALVITAQESQAEIEACFRAGADDYLLKPWTPIELRARIRSHLDRWRDARAILRAKTEWENTFDAVPDLIAILDTEHRIVRLNQAMADRMGLSKEEAVGQHCFTCAHHSDAPPAFCPFAQTLQDKCNHTVDIFESDLNGHFIVSTSPILNERDEITGIVHVAREITERVRLETELAKSKEVLDQTQELANLSGWDLNLATGELIWTQQNWRIFDLPPDHVPATESTIDLYRKDYHDTIRETIRKAIEEETPFDQEWPAITAKGRAIWVRAIGRLESNGDGEPHLCGSIQDITERKQLEDQLKYNASYDRMTGLRNRAAILDIMEQQVALAHRHKHPLTFCLADLDHFKRVNDTYGHQTGDRVLVRFAEILGEAIRESDGLGRYGGEEFIILLPHSDANGARNCIQRALDALREETFTSTSGETFQITATFGIAMLTPKMNLDTLIAKADRALYHGKEHGRNQIVYVGDLAEGG